MTIHSYNLSNGVIKLIVTLNLFHAEFGIFSSILDWIDEHSGSSMPESIGHMTCSVLVPVMVIQVVIRQWKNVSLDIQTEHRSETLTEWHECQIRHHTGKQSKLGPVCDCAYPTYMQDNCVTPFLSF